MSVYLFSGRENTGRSLKLTQNTANIPAEFDGTSESIIVDHQSIPCWFFSQPDFRGQAIKIIQGGGCDDLSTLPGFWFHKIRSIAFGHRLLEGAFDEVRLYDSKLFVAAEARKHPAPLNPLFATSGCYFPGNRRSATFNYVPWITFQIGQRYEIVVWTGNCSQYFCQGGQCVSSGDLTMLVDTVQQFEGNPFAKVVLWGTGA